MSVGTAFIDLIRGLHRLTGGLEARADRLEREGLARFLEECDADALEAEGRRRLPAAFRRAAERVPAYRALLSSQGVAPSAVKTLEDFGKLVPVTDKSCAFAAHPVSELCLDGDVGDLADVVTSSGHSGIFAFGLTGRREMAAARRAVDFALDYHFAAGRRKTLLVNVLPMGVKVSSSLCTVADVSVREDMALGIIKNFAPLHDQVILLGDPNFVKLILEEGRDRCGIDWSRMLIHVVVGEEYVPESWRGYVAGLIGSPDPADHDEGMVAFTMGAAEVGLNFLFESADIVRLRRAMVGNRRLLELLAPAGWASAPMIYHFNPLATHIEALPFDSGRMCRLTVTTLSEERRLPLVRYQTGDIGRVLSHAELCRGLDAVGLGHLRPRLRLPVVVILGRQEHLEATRDHVAISSTSVKEILYRDPLVAGAVTGNFRMSLVDGRILVEFQLRPGTWPTDELARRFDSELRRHLAWCYQHPYFRAFDAFLRGLPLPPEARPEWTAIYERNREKLKSFVRPGEPVFKTDGDFLELRFYAHDDFPYPIDWERKIPYIKL
jgi:phenylacetate-CoA ligase